MQDAAPITRRAGLRQLAGLCGGVAGLLGWAAGARAAASPLTVVHAFTGGAGGAHPASLALRSDGTLFGVAEAGGRQERGLVFGLAPSGAFQVVHRFGSGEAHAGGLGGGALSPLVEGPGGWMYGTTSQGGNWSKGLAYRLDELGRLVQLFHFTGGESDGQSPSHRLLPTADGELIGAGVRVQGGWNLLPQLHRLNPTAGTLRRLAQVGSGLNGLAQPAWGPDGQLYLMTASGGSAGRGGVYRSAPEGSGTGFADLIVDVRAPLPSLEASGGFLAWPDGWLYGTTANDPRNLGRGTLFRMSTAGQVQVLHRFNGTDGARPDGLAAGPDGAMYGVARTGGPLAGGAVYRFVPGQRGVQIVHAFAPGLGPVGQLVLGLDGRLYGCTSFGPPTGPYGQVYALRVN